MTRAVSKHVEDVRRWSVGHGGLTEATSCYSHFISLGNLIYQAHINPRAFDCRRFSIYINKQTYEVPYFLNRATELTQPFIHWYLVRSVTLKRVEAWSSLLTPSTAEMQNHDWRILGHSVALRSYARTNKMAITRTMYLGPFRANAVTMFSPSRFLSPRPLNSSLLIKFLRHEFLSWPNLLSLHS